MQPMIFRRVVFPEPDAPMTAINSPFSTVNSISDNAGVTTASLWYSFVIYFNSIIPICISSCQFARLILKNFDRRNDRCHDHQQHTDGKADRQSKLDMGGQQHIPK